MPAIRGVFHINPDTRESGIWIMRHNGSVIGLTDAELASLNRVQRQNLIRNRAGTQFTASFRADGGLEIAEGDSRSFASR